MYLQVAVKLLCKAPLYLLLNFRIKKTEIHMLSPEVAKTHYLEEFYYLLKKLLLSHMFNYDHFHYALLLYKNI